MRQGGQRSPRRPGKGLGSAPLAALALAACLLGAPARAQSPALNGAVLAARASDASLDRAERLRAIAALEADPDRASIGMLVQTLGGEPPGEVRDAIVTALIARTGRDDLESDAAAWRQWWQEHQGLDDDAWSAATSRALAERADRLAAGRDALARRLSESLGALLARTPAEERSALIASYLRDDLPEVRRAGFDLASRALLNAQPLGESVQRAAIDCLQHPSAAVREQAARLLENLGGDTAAPAALTAVLVEERAAPAAPLLRLASRSPTPALAPAALRWLAEGGGVRDAAAEALVALARAGALSDGERERALSILELISIGDVTPGVARLLAALASTPTERARVASLVGAPDEAVRIAAAEGLAATPEGLDTLARATLDEPRHYDLLARAVLARQVNGDGYAVLRRAQRAGRDAEPALARLLTTASPEEVLRAASMEAEAMDAVWTLETALGGAARRSDLEGSAVLQRGLARAAIELGDGARALAALDDADAISSVHPENAARLRAIALMLEGCPSVASRLGPDPACWTEAIDRLRRRPGRRAVAEWAVRALAGTSSPEALVAAMEAARLPDVR